jgi:hypothetical protein
LTALCNKEIPNSSRIFATGRQHRLEEEDQVTPQMSGLALPPDRAISCALLLAQQLDIRRPDMMKVKSALILTGLLGAGSAVAAIGAGRTLGGKPVEVIGGETPRVNGANVLAEHRLGNGRVLIVDALL